MELMGTLHVCALSGRFVKLSAMGCVGELWQCSVLGTDDVLELVSKHSSVTHQCTHCIVSHAGTWGSTATLRLRTNPTLHAWPRRSSYATRTVSGEGPCIYDLRSKSTRSARRALSLSLSLSLFFSFHSLFFYFSALARLHMTRLFFTSLPVYPCPRTRALSLATTSVRNCVLCARHAANVAHSNRAHAFTALPLPLPLLPLQVRAFAVWKRPEEPS
jgi:hypothetical protein